MFKDYLCKKILSKNSELHNVYHGQTCYLFGNGYSLKYIDLKKFNNVLSFTTGLNYIHKDFSHLNIVGDFHLHPGIFSPIWRHPYTHKITIINKTRKFLLKSKRIPDDIKFFTSLYNYPFLKKNKNTFYLHNFGASLDFNKINPAYEFSLMSGSIFATIGIAAYMGFKKIIFVGMDYLSSNPKHGHFYEHGIREKIVDVDGFVKNTKIVTNFYEKNYDCEFNFLSLKNSTSNHFSNIEYESFFDDMEFYKENTELVKKNLLDDLTRIEFKYLINKQ